MIEPMTKYTFLVHGEEFGEFLNGLYRLGILNIEAKEANITTYNTEIEQYINTLHHVINQLSKVTPDEDSVHDSTPQTKSAETLVNRYLYLESRVRENEIKIQNLENAIRATQPWGRFDKARLEALIEAGLFVKFYSCHEKEFRNEWQEQYIVEIISSDGPILYFIVIHTSEPDIQANAYSIPESTVHQLQEEKHQLERENHEAQLEIGNISMNLPKIRELLHEKAKEQEFAAAMQKSDKALEGKIHILRGFIPSNQKDKLNILIQKHYAVSIDSNVKPDDQPPVILKNNRFARLYESIAGLYSLPNYGELDLTPFFAPFFMMFFGFCLGDAGYGLVLILATYILQSHIKPELRKFLVLARYLGFATVLFGIITGTFFGINLVENTPSWLLPLRSVMITSNQAFNLALGLGFIQILFGLIIQAVNKIMQFGYKYSVTPLAWIILLLSIADLTLTRQTGIYAQYGAYISIVAILFFNDPDAALPARIGKGIWQLYGITGFIGDLLSYIRLFALGISSAILGLVINDIAGRMNDIPYIGWALFFIFLVVGHGANLLIASLGAFVHPLRLTFVEFYKNAGFTGGGKSYEPFGRKQVSET
ncbi:MAG: V-type ATP synthase subunit I [Saprospiraceae bacterium]|nr:V-type ATP synthase subunit I [Saprospiraceae bacterium]